jgi:Kdo2-lipid IVA lauroyltransferase/acyltransferase
MKFKHHLIYYSTRILVSILGLLPTGLISAMGRRFGAVVFVFASGERRKTLSSIQTAFPRGFSQEQAETLARTVWTRVGQNLFETVQWLKWPHERIVGLVVRNRGLENIEKALTRGKGALIVTAHLGHWELLGAYLASRYRISGIAKNLYDPRFDELVTNFREKKLKATMIKRGLALRGILAALRENQLVMALCDQDTGQDGVFVPFFGKPAWTQSGVARIALKTGAALVPAFMVRGTDERFEVHVERKIELPKSGNPEKDILETVRRYTEVIETYVKAYPDQWMWMHERWKTRPEGESHFREKVFG